MGIEENKEVMNQFLERLVKGDVSSGEFLTDDFVAHELHAGKDSDKKSYLEHALSLSVDDYSIDDMVAEGDKIIIRATLQASNNPAAKMIKIIRFTVCRFEGSQIAEMWFLNDLLAMFQKLGIIPPDGEIGL